MPILQKKIKVNCPFYFKIGACRHADRCSRLHLRPVFSQTILIKHIYNHPVREAELTLLASGQDRSTASANIINAYNNKHDKPNNPNHDENGGSDSGHNNHNNNNNNNNNQYNNHLQIDEQKAQEDFYTFFEDFHMELSKFGRIEALHILDNLGDHLVGHIYVKYSDEEEASDALNIMNGRYYKGRKMEVEFSPVVDFREARCRDYDEDVCSRGGFCNFMHVKPVPLPLLRDLEREAEEERRRVEESEEERRREKRDRERRRKRKHKDRDRDRDRERDRDRDRDRDRERDRDRDRERRREKKRSRRSDSRDRSETHDDGAPAGERGGSSSRHERSD